MSLGVLGDADPEPGLGGAAGGGGGGLGGAPLGDTPEDPFRALSAGEDVWLRWGSQVGMGLGLTLRLAGLSDLAVSRVEVELLVDGAPLGLDVHEPPAFSCVLSHLSLEAMVMVDVGPHPTVTSVAQLDEREAEVRYRVINAAGGEVLSGALAVTLNL